MNRSEDKGSNDASPDRLTNDALFDVLSDEYRRYFIYYLLERDVVSGDDLREAAADWVSVEGGTTADRLVVRFYHVDIPVMVQAGLVDYDPTDDSFSLGETSPGVREILRRSRARERFSDRTPDGEP